MKKAAVKAVTKKRKYTKRKPSSTATLKRTGTLYASDRGVLEVGNGVQTSKPAYDEARLVALDRAIQAYGLNKEPDGLLAAARKFHAFIIGADAVSQVHVDPMARSDDPTFGLPEHQSVAGLNGFSDAVSAEAVS